MDIDAGADMDEPQIGAPATAVLGNNIEVRPNDISKSSPLQLQQVNVALSNLGANVTMPTPVASSPAGPFHSAGAPEQPHRAVSVGPQPQLAVGMSRKV